MKKLPDVFFEMPCLTESSNLLSGIAIQKKWLKFADKRMIGQYLQKFIEYNSSVFSFLGVKPFLVGTDQNISMSFRSSQYVGAIPLRASDNGKPIGDFVVIPRFSGKNKLANYTEILDLLEDDISPQRIDSFPLASGTYLKPPMYLEAAKFIKSIEDLLKTSWRKFESIHTLIDQPVGRINWNKYSRQMFKTENHLRFPVKKNYLTEIHTEYSELRFVFDICQKELLSSNTPIRIKQSFRSRLKFVEEKLYLHQSKRTQNITIKSSDSIAVKRCKFLANVILSRSYINNTAWRIDFSDVFEKFVQHLFKETAREGGGKLFPNPKFKSKSPKLYSWELKYVEPDAVFKKDEILIFIDAKYKSNLYNKDSKSLKLKEDYRHDLHQILAYSSFANTAVKYGILCYPSNEVEKKKVRYRNDINGITCVILILGIP